MRHRLCRLTAGQYDALDIGLLYMQVLDLVYKFSSQYKNHSDAYKWITHAFNIVNFDVDVRMCVCLCVYMPSMQPIHACHACMHACI